MSQQTLLAVPSDNELSQRFQKVKPQMTDNEAAIEASRCLFCHDAPCVTACPTEIDVPMFIRQIMSRNPGGAAKRIFAQNIMGRACADVCPTKVLCEGACVYHQLNKQPIDIGRLQGYATKYAIDRDLHFYTKGQSTGKRVAIIGGGPAGLACAHELTVLGHEAVVYEASARAGGLNAYGVAPYKYSNDDVAKEVAYISAVGFEIKTGQRITTDRLKELDDTYDAVFLGVGLGASQRLRLVGEKKDHVYGAAEFIYRLRDQEQRVEVGQRVVVVGAGNTAVDAAVESAKLGADVTMIYRRSEKEQSAYDFEVDLAKHHGVQLLYLTSPVEVLGDGVATGLRCVKNVLTTPDPSGRSGVRPIEGSEFDVACDMVIFATGQEKMVDFFQSIPGLTLKNGRVTVNHDQQTGNDKYFAGGDCVNGGKEVVNAVAHGRDAARGIDRFLTRQQSL